MSPLRLEVVSFFAVHAEVETLALLRLIGANPSHSVAYFENDKGSHDCEYPGDRAGDELVDHLAGVAIDPSHRFTHPHVVNLPGGENAGEDRANGAADTMHAEGVERVIIAEFVLDDADHEVAHHAGDQAN